MSRPPRIDRRHLSLPFALALLPALIAVPAGAVIPFAALPSWESNPNGEIATGGGFADINDDGWPDMVVANGNDIQRQRVALYRNQGNGTFPANATWTSSDVDYHGHLDLGDVNGDGRIDVVVAVYLGPAGFGDPGRVKLYLNNGAGAFASSPSWTSSDRFYCFSVALGDADGDGDLDLACACGDDYNDKTERQRIYYNVGGTFQTTPGWTSSDVSYALDVTWGDVDRDGDLDPTFCGTSAPVRYYRNAQTVGGGISTTATWQNTDLPQFGNTSSFGDWNGDGYPELAVADNDQLGGAGRFKVYANTAGTVGTTPIWLSSDGGYGSNVTWADLDLDGDIELITGRWWDPLRIYENTGGTLTTAPVWQSTTAAVTENIYLGDVDRDGRRSNGLSVATGNGTRTHFSLGQAPVEDIQSVLVNGVPATHCEHLGNGWVSIAPPPPSGATVQVAFDYSADEDMGVTNWDSGVGNYLFLNTRTAADVAPALAQEVFFGAYPNPVQSSTQLRYLGPSLAHAELAIFDAGGRRVRTLARGSMEGLRLQEWDGRDTFGRRVPAGAYFARLTAGASAYSTRIVVLPL